MKKKKNLESAFLQLFHTFYKSQKLPEIQYTVQSLYNTPLYNTHLDMNWSCCGSQFFFAMESGL